MPIERRPAGVVVFDRVTKFNGDVQPPDVIFASVSLSLPTNRKLAILGRQETGRTTLLQLMKGQAQPDAGGVLTTAKFSMILNSESFLHSGLTGLENVQSLARMHSLHTEKTKNLAVSLPGIKSRDWYKPVREMTMRDRRTLEILVAAVLPYDCYLIDDIERADQNAVGFMMSLIAARGAGIIFTTYSSKIARQHGDCAGVIAYKSLRLFSSVSEAEIFYDR